MHLNYKHYPMVSLTLIQRNEMSYKSVIFMNQTEILILVQLDGFYNISFVFFCSINKNKNEKNIFFDFFFNLENPR